MNAPSTATPVRHKPRLAPAWSPTKGPVIFGGDKGGGQGRDTAALGFETPSPSQHHRCGSCNSPHPTQSRVQPVGCGEPREPHRLRELRMDGLCLQRFIPGITWSVLFGCQPLIGPEGRHSLASSSWSSTRRPSVISRIPRKHGGSVRHRQTKALVKDRLSGIRREDPVGPCQQGVGIGLLNLSPVMLGDIRTKLARHLA